jgi:hypothetical protein
MNEVSVKPLSFFLGETFLSIKNAKPNSDEVTFVTSSNRTFKMEHEQDCCEYVRLIDVVGDISDLLDSPITLAESITKKVSPEEVSEYGEWTFYRLGTLRGIVTLRWLGETNSCYSLEVNVFEVK